MEQQSVRKTFKYKLIPTPEQERAMATVVWRCRELYNAGLQERKAAWEKRGVCVTFAMQSAQLPAIKQVRPEYNDLKRPGLARRAASPGQSVCRLLPPPAGR
jgi:transposase